MEALSRFEANLLTIVHALFDPNNAARGIGLINDEFPQPPCLSKGAVRLLEDTLRKGIVRFFVEQGAWKHRAVLRNEAVVNGRLWELHDEEALGFTFSAYTVHVLLWLTATDAQDQKLEIHPAAPLTLGDRMVMLLAMNLVHDRQMARNWKKQNHFVKDAMVHLLFPSVNLDVTSPPQVDYGRWLSPQGILVLQGLQSLLAARWEDSQRLAIRSLHQTAMLTELDWQSQTLGAFLQAINEKERRDLARFLLIAAKRLFTEEMTFKVWTERLTTKNLRISERTQLYNRTIMFANHFQTLENWYRESLTIGYLDEGYAQSQWYKGTWEEMGLQETAVHAENLRRGADPLASTGT